MGINRVQDVPFAQIANAALRDKRLSFKARGLLAMVLSHSGEWEASREWLISQSEVDGKAAIQTALNELTELGYREVRHEQTESGIRTVVVWKHCPDEPISRPSENLTVGEPDRRANGRAIEHHPSEHNRKEHNHVRFDDFWQAYPNRKAKGAAAKAWNSAVKKADPEVIIAAAGAYARDPKRDPQYTAHAATWLNGERWLDEVEAPKSSGPGTLMEQWADEPCEHGDMRGERACALCRRKAEKGPVSA